jgi:glutamyl-tRNA reductase
MTILLIGLNHRTAPVEIRERLALDACAPVDAYYKLHNLAALSERLFLSTCNRVEVLSSTSNPEQAIEDIKYFLGSFRDVSPADFESCLYMHKDVEAVRHLFKVASSLDSMVVGEPQILGQLKDAFRTAVENHATGAILNKLLHKSFSVAKRVRTETGIASHAVSIGFAAVKLARKIFGDLQGKKVLLVGAGEMAELTAEHLLGQGASNIVVANRTLKRAMELAQRWGGQAASLDELPRLLAEVDIVISSTGAQNIVINTSMVKSVLKPRKHRPLFFVDIAVPRDVENTVHRLSNVYLYDIDDLQTVVEENRAARSEEAIRAERIVEEEIVGFLNWMETLDTFPTIVALTEKAERIRMAEFEKTLTKIGPLPEEHVQALHVMTRALTHKLVHDPILFIKTAGRHGKKEFNLHLARRILGLDEPNEKELESTAPYPLKVDNR